MIVTYQYNKKLKYHIKILVLGKNNETSTN